MLTVTLAILGITVIGQVILLGILLRERTSLIQYLFTVYIVAVVGWTVSIFLYVLLQKPEILQFAFAFAAIFLTTQFWFAKSFPDKVLPNNVFAYWSIAIGSIFLGSSFVEGALFKSVTLSPQGYIVIENGFLSAYYSLFALFFASAPVVLFIKTFRNTCDPNLKSQLKYLITGFSIFLGINILTNSVLPVFFDIYFFNAIGPVFSLILASFVFYIIWRHEFLDIRIILQRGLVYLALSVPLIAAYFGLNFGLESLFSLLPHTNALLSAFVTLCVAAFSLYAVERYFEKVRLLTVGKEYAAQLEREVAERTKHLRELQEYQRRMMDDISHAIQTPVTVIRSAMEGAHHGTPYEKTYQAVEKSIDDLSRLAQDFLHLSKLESLLNIAHERFSLSDTIAEIAEYAGVVCEESGITLRQSIEHDIPIHGDRLQIEELVRNLLSNAIKYTKDSKRRQVYIVLKRTAEHVEIRIEDTGIGIPAEALPHVFERFFRASDSPHGVGLGLSICKRIVELHGGTTMVKSIEGEGSTFIVRLSRLQAGLPAASVAQVRLS